MAVNKVSDYIAYFKAIATQHKSIQHTANAKRFFRMNIEEILAGNRSEIDWQKQVFILQNFEGRLEDLNSDNIRNIRRGAFLILQKAGAHGDFNEEENTLEACYNTGMDIIARMRRDRRDYDNTAVKDFKPGSVAYFKTGPLFDNAVGYTFEFDLPAPISLAYTPANWLDE